MTSLSDNATLAQAKTELRQNWQNGVDCPCCGQFVHLQPRSIYRAMATELLRLAELSWDDRDYHHISEYRIAHGGDFTKLRYWGLIEEAPNDDPKKRSSGFWRITTEGWDYCHGRLYVVKTKLVFNKKVRGEEGPKVNLYDALGENFDYSKYRGWLL